MKIRPVKTKSKPMTPAVLAVISTLLTGCDRQSIPGDVPHRVPGEPRNNILPAPSRPSPHRQQSRRNFRSSSEAMCPQNIYITENKAVTDTSFQKTHIG